MFLDEKLILKNASSASQGGIIRKKHFIAT